MKKSLIFLALLGSLAAALPVVFSYPAAAQEAAKPDAKGEDGAKKKGADEDTSGGRFAGDPIYVHLPPMILPVINENGVEQLVTLIMDVQVKDFDAADTMHTNMPKVQDSLMRALYGGLGQGVLRKGKLVDVSKVKNKAVAAVGEVIGADNVRDVLIQSVSQRML